MTQTIASEGDGRGPGGSDARPWARFKNGWRKAGTGPYIDIVILGTTGAGKTTMLASMYEQLRDVASTAALDIVANKRGTSARLDDYLEDLRNLPRELRVKPLPSTENVHEFEFDVGLRARRPLFKVRFTDYPGRHFVRPELADPQTAEKIDRAIQRADVVIIAIDTPALVEKPTESGPGRYHQTFNQPGVVLDAVRTMLREDMDRLIILVPLKCEKYVATPKASAALATKVTGAYQPLLSYIKADEVQSRVGCVLTPVQTVGSVEFARIDEGGEQVEFVFLAKGRGATYRPQDTDQPLRWALRFIVGKYRATSGPLRSAVQRIMGADAALVAAMAVFGDQCKEGDGFEVLQKHRFLRRERPR